MPLSTGFPPIFTTICLLAGDLSLTTQTPFFVTLFAFMNAVTVAAIGPRSQSCAFIPVKEGGFNLTEIVNDANHQTVIIPGPYLRRFSRWLWRLQQSLHNARNAIGQDEPFCHRRSSRRRHCLLL